MWHSFAHQFADRTMRAALLWQVLIAGTGAQRAASASVTPPPPPPSRADFAFADSFSSNMVLQQLPSPSVLWGFAAPGAVVTVHRATGSHGTAPACASSTVGTDDGVWRVQMAGMNASNETFTFVATNGSTPSCMNKTNVAGSASTLARAGATTSTLTISNVVYGAVWVCSGQSNMAFLTAMAFNATEVLAAAADTDVRLFAANMSCAHGKVCHFNKSHDRLSPCTRPPCFSTGPEKHWVQASADVLSADGKGGISTSEANGWRGSFSAVCYLFGRRLQESRGYPVGLIASYIGGTPDECWSSTDALAECPGSSRSAVHMDWGDCWYSMITPLLRTPIEGTVWYQGETDTLPGGSPGHGERALNYNCTFPAMVRDWRAKFHAASEGATNPNFPFGFVQLAPWGASTDANNGCGQGSDLQCQVATLRWGQTADTGTALTNMQLPNTFMATATDLADFNSPYGSIHPRHKIEVGDRLAAAARAEVYNESDQYWTGPVLPTAHVESGTGPSVLRVQFKNCAAAGMELRETVGFEIKVNGLWAPTPAIRDAQMQKSCAVDLTLPSSNGDGGVETNTAAQTVPPRRPSTLTDVRYNWYRVVCFANQTRDGAGAGRCAVYADGIPAPPFRIAVAASAVVAE